MGPAVFYCIIGIPALVLFAGLVYSFVLGVRAFRRGSGQHGEYATTLRFLALNLCEPLINTFLVTFLVFSQRNSSDHMLFLVTMPMAVLVIPVFGLWFSDPFYRDKSLRILLLGLARWGINLLVFMLLNGHTAPMDLVLVPLSTGVFWYSVRWGKRQLDGPLYAAYRPAWACGTPVASSMPSPVSVHPRPAAPPAAPISVPPPPLDMATAIRCALCHTPTAREASACPACGLVFLSRVPAALHAFSRYVVLRPLGHGGMSSVYLARDRSDGQFYVLKTLVSVDEQPDLAWHAEAAACLRHEAELLCQIDHPNVARLIDRIDNQQGSFLVLEYIAGPTLEQRLTRPGGLGATIPGAALPLGEALAYGCGVAEILRYLAGLPQPVVHCDIKPANLILPSARRTPVLVDFGGAVFQQIRPLETTRLALYGTPGYAAPEQYQGSSSPKSDVYGLAATLYHLLTDDDPSRHPLAFPALATLPPNVARVLAPALAHDPAARPDAGEFSAGLRQAVETAS